MKNKLILFIGILATLVLSSSLYAAPHAQYRIDIDDQSRIDFPGIEFIKTDDTRTSNAYMNIESNTSFTWTSPVWSYVGVTLAGTMGSEEISGIKYQMDPNDYCQFNLTIYSARTDPRIDPSSIHCVGKFSTVGIRFVQGSHDPYQYNLYFIAHNKA